MAYDEFLADRLRNALKEQHAVYEEKKMFGGLCFMVDDKMCVGIIKNELMARINPEKQDYYLQKKGARLMEFTHRPMKGFLQVSTDGIDLDSDLDAWVSYCLEFNPLAKSSKKKK